MLKYLFGLPQKTINSIKCLNKIPCINRGGCGLAAIAIYNFVTTVHPDCTPHIVYATNEKAELLHNIKNRILSSSSHVLVKVGTKYYDSTGEYTARSVKSVWEVDHIVKVPVQLARQSVLDYRLWHTSFDRRQGLKEINKFTEIHIR